MKLQINALFRASNPPVLAILLSFAFINASHAETPQTWTCEDAGNLSILCSHSNCPQGTACTSLSNAQTPVCKGSNPNFNGYAQHNCTWTPKNAGQSCYTCPSTASGQGNTRSSLDQTTGTTALTSQVTDNNDTSHDTGHGTGAGLANNGVDITQGNPQGIATTFNANGVPVYNTPNLPSLPTNPFGGSPVPAIPGAPAGSVLGQFATSLLAPTGTNNPNTLGAPAANNLPVSSSIPGVVAAPVIDPNLIKQQAAIDQGNSNASKALAASFRQQATAAPDDQTRQNLLAQANAADDSAKNIGQLAAVESCQAGGGTNCTPAEQNRQAANNAWINAQDTEKQAKTVQDNADAETDLSKKALLQQSADDYRKIADSADQNAQIAECKDSGQGCPPAANGTTSGSGRTGNAQTLTTQIKAEQDRVLNNGKTENQDNRDAKDVHANTFKTSMSDCKNSADVNGSGCSGLHTMITSTEVTAQVASQIGSKAVNIIGQQSQQNALLNGGSIASIYESSAKLSAKAAEANMGMGTVQVGMGYLINRQASQHSKNSKDFNALKFSAKQMDSNVSVPQSGMVTETGGNLDTAQKLYEAATKIGAGEGENGIQFNAGELNSSRTAIFQANGEGRKTLQAEQSAAAKSANGLKHVVVSEQNQAASDGMNSAMQNYMQGGGAIVSGGFQYAQAKQMEKLYAAMANTPTANAPGADPFAAPGAIRAASTVTGDGTNGATAAATAATPTAAASGGPLGAPLGNAPGPANLGTPAEPGAPVAAAPGSPSGSGAGPGGGIGTSAVPGGATDEKTAQYDAGRNAAPYEGVGGFAPGTGGGGKGNSNDPSIDPKTLMAAMLDQMGQKKDEDQAPGILNYRSIASDSSAPLPREENFFTRFSQDYKELTLKGRVGL